MHNLKISTRLVIGFAVMLLFIALVAGVGIWRVQSSDAMAQDLTETRLYNERNISKWHMLTALNGTRTIANAKLTDPGTIAYFQDMMKETAAEISKLQTAVEKSITDPQALKLFAVVQERRSEYVSKRNAAVQARKDRNFAASRDFFENQLEGLLGGYTQSIQNLLAYQQNLINERADELHHENEIALTLLVGLAIAALAIGVLIAVGITRSITLPLRNAVNFAEKVSSRDLTGNISVKGKNEVATLLTALQRMNANLLDVVREVREGANSIASASTQIAAGNTDLSSRTEEQASSLAETAATMEEITTTVKQNADNANQAHGLAESAANVATHSGQVVSQVVETMGAINDSSKQIVDIISVIDGIAFQTNILALNAAVEAARAGEQGKGFAVVASEVRSLAQRSAQAAKEIKDLIDKSASITEEGNRLVAKAGSTMGETVDSIRRVTDIMDEITSASQEQSIGIDQVNQAVAQMDQVTQQNASLVQEASAASASLQDQATSLARLVATFRVEAQVHQASGKSMTEANTPVGGTPKLLGT
ncbi:MAG: hypothetical protein CML16_06415 [Pusillimonas sp.]|nr:hypothetical protein [Pusillimonas sp.]MBC41629.1 hypothetical protein [Pusillimonas sp.]HCP77034.1 hypothetical protein [Pusillimonas sp.]